MMTFIKDKDFILDNKAKDGVFIIDMNSQNILSDAAKVFADNFPVSYNRLVDSLASGETLYNRAIVLEEKGFKFIVLFAQMNITGNDIDTADDIAYVANDLIRKIVNKYGHDLHYHSPMLYKDSGAWRKISKYIKKNNLKWGFYAN